MKELIASIRAAVKAGEKIMEIYEKDFEIELKSDKSPLTEADKAAHVIIKSFLEEFEIPILSEEGKMTDYKERESWTSFWMVDPLDGTKEFIKKNGEFTVNIALIKDQKPVLGVVYVPVTKVIYFGTEKEGSFKTINVENKDIENLIKNAVSLPVEKKSAHYTIVASRSHNTSETEEFINERKKIHGEIKLISAGSSLKLCLVAEGKADVYPRLAPTMEWDTAAGHAVAKFAGCEVSDFKTGNEIIYNKENLLNPWFIVERHN